MQAFYLQQQATHSLGSKEHSLPGLKLRYYPSPSQSSDESEETKRCAGRTNSSLTVASHDPLRC